MNEFLASLKQITGLGSIQNAHDLEIAQQAHLTACGLYDSRIPRDLLAKNSTKLLKVKPYYLVIKAVFLSHILDDVADQYKQHQAVVSELHELLKTYPEDPKSFRRWTNSIFSEVILLMKSCMEHSKTRWIETILAEIYQGLLPERQEIFQNSILRMITAGLAQNLANCYADQPLEILKLRQQTLMSLYTRLSTHLLRVGKVIDLLGSIANWEAQVSLASSLQEQFLIFGEYFDLDLTEAWNAILGPLLFLFNRKQEIAENQAVFFNDAPSEETYVMIVSKGWNCVRELEKVVDIKVAEVRYWQFYRIWLSMNSLDSPHSFTTFRQEYPDLANIFEEIAMMSMNQFGIEHSD